MCLFLFTGSVTEKPPGPSNSGRKGELRSVAGLHEYECLKWIEKKKKNQKCRCECCTYTRIKACPFMTSCYFTAMLPKVLLFPNKFRDKDYPCGDPSFLNAVHLFPLMILCSSPQLNHTQLNVQISCY